PRIRAESPETIRSAPARARRARVRLERRRAGRGRRTLEWRTQAAAEARRAGVIRASRRFESARGNLALSRRRLPCDSNRMSPPVDLAPFDPLRYLPTPPG